MTAPKPLQARLRSLADRQGQKITGADARLAMHAASLIDGLESAMRIANDRASIATSDACSSGALVSVVRTELRELLAHIERHA